MAPEKKELPRPYTLRFAHREIQQVAEKLMKAVILRSQQAALNPAKEESTLLENLNTDPSLLLRMTARTGFIAAC